MAGRRHHHVWQLLQRGFSWQEHGDDQIWIYRKGTLPKQSVTRKFGRVTEFYGPEGSIADTNITSFEGKIQSFLQDVRKMGDRVELDPNIVAPFIAHLEMRSLFLRSEISRVSERMISGVREHFTSRDKLKALMLNHFRKNPTELNKHFEKAGVPAESWPLLLEMIDVGLPDMIDQSSDDLSPGINVLFDELQKLLASVAKSAHIKSLENDFTETERASGHITMRYFVNRASVDSLILPDTSLAFFKTSGLSPISQKSDKIEAVVVPVSTEVAIIGSKTGQFNRDVPTMQRALASCAYDAFIAPSRTQAFIGLSERISKNAQLISEVELNKMLRFESLFS